MVENKRTVNDVIVPGTHLRLMVDVSGECCITISTGEGVTLANSIIKLLDGNITSHKIR
ncbi:MAG: hypothetical protein OJF59_002750 [Cytophagales bacterium]|nr:hypothetical protein [Bacteroidota bacterium]WHZ08996.1 MAG: hypothetical protein OJF59_002750 [Cytophagales bacterium]